MNGLGLFEKTPSRISYEGTHRILAFSLVLLIPKPIRVPCSEKIRDLGSLLCAIGLKAHQMSLKLRG